MAIRPLPPEILACVHAAGKTFTHVADTEGDVCEVAGHVWFPAGGGLLICSRCEATKWDDAVGSSS